MSSAPIPVHAALQTNHTSASCRRAVTLPFDVQARWIGAAGLRDRECFYLRKCFDLPCPGRLVLRISAFPAFRAWLDGRWIGDGPVRGWPQGYYFEEYEVDAAPGTHELRLLIHKRLLRGMVHLPESTGACVQILFVSPGGVMPVAISGLDWEVAVDLSRDRHVPRIFPLAGDFESVDFRRDALFWNAVVPVSKPLCEPSTLRLRDVAPSFQRWLAFPSALFSGTLPSPVTPCVVPVRSLVGGCERSDISIHSTMAFGLVATLEVDRETVWFGSQGHWRWFLDGQELESGRPIPRGAHTLAAFTRSLFHHLTELAWELPANLAEHCTGWKVIDFPSLDYLEDDIIWPDHPEEYKQHLEVSYQVEVDLLGAATGDRAALESALESRLRVVAEENLFFPDPHAGFMAGEPADLKRDPGWTVEPQPAGTETELHFDLGAIHCGFAGFDVEAPAGTQLDLFAVEHIRADGVRQHTGSPNCNRNGLRFTTVGGRQQFLSTVQRGGRHWFLRVRHATAPVQIHGIGLLESGYPARKIGHFHCSDPVLEKTWRVSERTMELCSDDVFVDSLYEQALWIGDAYGEQLYALRGWDAQDISLRSLRLGADSLRDFPIVISQAPSSWACFIPIWSILWGYGVRDYWFHTGDRSALASLWPDFRRNLAGLLFHVDASGLFNAPLWNLFEWARIDWRHRLVLQNSFFLAGLLDRGVEIARVLGEHDAARKWRSTAVKIRRALRREWDAARQAYPDSLPEDPARERSFSIHTQFLALLYGGTDEPNRSRLVDLSISPPADFTPIASPFALQFYYEALEGVGADTVILDSMRTHYGAMLQAGADTFWEGLPGSVISPEGFPTRSHCHGWAAAPMDFLPRIVLGIRQTSPGGLSYTVRPFVAGLDHASGAVAGALGPVEVHWEKTAAHELKVLIRHPERAEVVFESDPSVVGEGLTPLVEFQSRSCSQGEPAGPVVGMFK